jgi:N-acylneuraminate cytidylyltransferase
MKNAVAVIPARAGSKRIPLKNTKLFCGKPMIVYAIEAALKSDCFEHIVVSTDSPEIAELARQYGAEAPYTRPAELSNDYATSAEVFVHALEWEKINRSLPEFACMIYATSPLLMAKDIQKGFELVQRPDVESAFSVTTFPFPIFRGMTINKDGYIRMIWPEHLTTRSQDLTEAYHDAGQFYWVKSSRFLETKKILSDAAVPVVLPRKRVQDIDTPEDWEMAELAYQVLLLSEREEL